MLYLISTPIGNLKDITLRAIETLSSVDCILAEDTRTAGILLKHHQIPKKQFITYNDYNALKKIPQVIELLKQGKEIALISENGTPCISDPGYKLVRECIKNDIDITPVPGPSAFLSALVASGFPTDRFSFYGFLPKSKKKKLDMFKKAKEDKITSIFYESPHRIIKTLTLLDEEFPEDLVCVAREISKKFEEFIRAKPSEILGKLKAKGEFVLIIGET